MPLKGVKVLEFAGLAPAPFCGMILADFGATVTRIDKVGANVHLDSLANGKRSIAIDLKLEKGKHIVKKLCRAHDVLLEPFRMGVMENLGLGPKTLLQENPRLIYARLNGFGKNGNYSRKAGHDINYVALSGLLSLFGRAGDKPTFPVNLAADFGGGGLMSALGILLALFERTKSGVGQIVDNNMVHGTAYLGSWLFRSQNLPIWGNKRGQNVLDTGAHFYDVYETKDGKFISIGALEPKFYQDLIKGLGFDDEEAPQFLDSSGKLKKLFTDRFLTKTLDEWMEVFKDLDACVAPVLSLQEAAKFRHNVENDMFVSSHETICPSPAPNLSRTAGVSKSSLRSPYCGEHTEEILKDLRYSTEEINQFKKLGVIESTYTSKL